MLARRGALVVALVVLLAPPLAGCANPGSMPRVHVGVTVGTAAHLAVVHISASGRCGGAYSGVVLTYPDGHRRLLGTACYGVGEIGRFEVDGIPSGAYTCTVYATPFKNTDESGRRTGSGFRPFPVDRMIEKNIVASRTFVIP
jgi:hypothetical protein